MTTLLRQTLSGLGITVYAAVAIAPWASMQTEVGPLPESLWTSEWLGSKTPPYPSEIMTDAAAYAVSVKSDPDVSALVRELRSESGLTANQLGRLLGVSRRSVYNWAAGSPIAAAREERLRELHSMVLNLPAKSPDMRRNLLLDSSNGPSIFRQFVEGGKKNQRIKYSVPVEERFGL